MKVFICDISKVSSEQLNQFASFLSETERNRLQNMISVKRQREFICGHYLLRKILSEETNKALNEIEINTLNSGALVLADSSFGYISLSHSHEQVAVAVASNPVGLDMEWIQSKDNYNAILEQIDAVKDAGQLLSQGYTMQETFFRLWTRREAYYKLSSVEQSPFDKTNFSFFQQSNFMFCVACTSPEQIEWKIYKSIDKSI